MTTETSAKNIRLAKKTPKLRKGTKSLAEVNPVLAKQWHPTDNGEYTPHNTAPYANYQAVWQCEHGHVWKASVHHRTRGTSCPYCANHKVWVGFNDLATTHPDVAAEWHPTKNGALLPQDIVAGSTVSVYWQCKAGHEWQRTVKSRTQGSRCPICTNQEVLVGFNDLATTHPHLVAQWHPTKNGELKPTDVVAGSQTHVVWQCEHGHEWTATVVERKRGRQCPHCSNQTSFNEQALLYYIQQMCPDACNRAKIAGKEADIYIPSLKIVVEYDGWHHNESRMAYDIQKAIHMEQHGMHFIRIREPDCPLLPNIFGDLFVMQSKRHADIKQAVYWCLQQIIKYDSQLVMPDIDLTRDALKIRAKITYARTERSIAYVYPELCSEWDWERNAPLTPTMVSAHARTKVFWRCPQGHSYYMAPNTRVRCKYGCPECACVAASKKIRHQTQNQYVGKVVVANNSRTMILVEYTGYDDCTIQWDDGSLQHHVKSYNFMNGKVAYHPDKTPIQIDGKPVYVDVPQKEKPVIPDGLYYVKSNRTGANAIMEIVGDDVIIKAGSVVSYRMSTKVKPSTYAARQALQVDDQRTVLHDMKVSSITCAASVVMGSRTKGWDAWRTADGQPISIYQ